MQVVIEFYRTRSEDDAHAAVGSEVAEAADVDDAIKIAWRIFQTLNMPQNPDAMKITDPDGNMLYSSPLETATGSAAEPES